MRIARPRQSNIQLDSSNQKVCCAVTIKFKFNPGIETKLLFEMENERTMPKMAAQMTHFQYPW